jgi:hypothetical protein
MSDEPIDVEFSFTYHETYLKTIHDVEKAIEECQRVLDDPEKNTHDTVL